MIELLELLLTTLGSVCQRRPRLRSRDKLFWLLVRHLLGSWRRHLLLVRPETVLRWHRQGWRRFWHWRSHHPLGRPRLTFAAPQVNAASSRIVRIATNHAHASGPRTFSWSRPWPSSPLRALFLISHDRRRLLHFNVTALSDRRLGLGAYAGCGPICVVAYEVGELFASLPVPNFTERVATNRWLEDVW